MKRARTTEVTMREFRSAPAKILKRAARAGARLRVGEFVLAVEEARPTDDEAPSLHGCMKATGRITGRPSDLLSARDDWSTDA